MATGKAHNPAGRRTLRASAQAGVACSSEASQPSGSVGPAPWSGRSARSCKWQYIREDRLTDLIDRFFGTYVFGPNAVAHFRSQHTALAPALSDPSTERRERLTRRLADLDQRIARQIAAIESGVDPVLVGERIRALKAERHETETALTTLHLEQRQRTVVDLDHACTILGGLPDLSRSLAEADPELRRQIYERFQFAVELDRNKPEVRMKALVSTAFMEANDLEDLAAVMVADKSIAGERFVLIGDLSVPIERVFPWPRS